MTHYGTSMIIAVISGLAFYFNLPSSLNKEEPKTAKGSNFIEDPEAAPSLVKVALVLRHGERGPLTSSPFYQLNEQDWPDGLSALTKVGKRNSYTLGKRLRRRYNSILTPHYSTDNLIAKSTETERTLMTAYLVLAGMYPPADHQAWNDDIKWTPIPVFHKSQSPNYSRCPRMCYEALSNLKALNLESTLENSKVILREVLPSILKSPENTVPSIFLLYDIVTAVLNNENVTVDDWTKDFKDATRKAIHSFYFAVTAKSFEQKQLSSSIFGRVLLDFVEDPRRVMLFSGHDLSLYVLSGALGFEFEESPMPTACVAVEFHREGDREFVKAFFIPSANHQMTPVKMTCGDECDLSSFRDMLLKLVPTDYEALCNSDMGQVDLHYRKPILEFITNLPQLLP